MTSISSSSPRPPTLHPQSSQSRSTPVDLIPAIYLPERLASMLIPSRSPSLPTKIKLPFMVLPDDLKQQLTISQGVATHPAEQTGTDGPNRAERGIADVPRSVHSARNSIPGHVSLRSSLSRSMGGSTIVPRPGNGLSAVTPVGIPVNSLDNQMKEYQRILERLGVDQGQAGEKGGSEKTARPGSMVFPILRVGTAGIDEVDAEVCFLCGGEMRRSGVVLVERGVEGWQWICKGGCGE